MRPQQGLFEGIETAVGVDLNDSFCGRHLQSVWKTSLVQWLISCGGKLLQMFHHGLKNWEPSHDYTID